MTLIALLLLLISSILHAGWNLFTKGRKLGIEIFMIAFFFGAAAFLPFAVLCSHNFLNLITKKFILYLLSSSLFQCVYHITLIKSYEKRDLSFAYPLIRSLPVLLIALIQSIFFNAALSPLVFSGIFLIITGSLLLPIQDSVFKNGIVKIIRSYHIFIFLAALGTAGYTLIDARALSLMTDLVPDNSILMRAFIWASLQNGVDFIFLLLYMLIIQKSLVTEIKKTDWRFSIFVLLSMNVTHLFVLGSMYFVRDVSYVAALRQLSIPIGAVFGIVLLKEKPYKFRIIGVALIFAGIISVVLT